MNTIRLACTGAFAAATLTAHAGTPVAWTNPAGGVWHLASNWDPATIPGASDGVLLGLKGAYLVSITSQNASAASLTLANPDATLVLNPGRTLTVHGPIANQGLVSINPTNTAVNTTLQLNANAALTGPGHIALNGTSTRAQIIPGVAGVVLTQSAGHTIRGQGVVTVALVNNGLVSADVASGSLTLSTHPKTNNARMEAVGGATLVLQSAAVAQDAGAVIAADGAGSVVELSNAAVTGGSLLSSGGGFISIFNTSGLHGLTLDADARLNPGHLVDASGVIRNDGRITINPINSAINTTLRVADGAVLTGEGRVTLNGTGTRAQVTPATADAALTNSAGHTIHGRGVLNITLTNNGLVSADVPDAQLTVSTRPTSNNTRMEAVGGATLQLQSLTVTQHPDAVIAAEGEGSVVLLSAASIVGGTLRSADDAIFTITSSSAWSGLTADADARITPGHLLDVSGVIRNDGQITVNPTNAAVNTTIRIADGTALTGGGRVTLNGTSTRAQITPATGGAVLTQDAGHAIHGHGVLSAGFVNHGLVSADVPGGELALGTGAKFNNARMEAVSGGALTIQFVGVQQSTNAVITAEGDGSVVQLSGAAVAGGSIRSSDGGIVTILNNTGIENLTLDADARLTAGHQLVASGAIHHTGRLNINPTNGAVNTTLRITDGAVLTGEGRITLGGVSTRSQLSPATAGAVLTLGPGQRLEGIGTVGVSLNHHGTIAPGLGLGTMTASQPVSFSDSSTLEIEVAGNNNADLLSSTSSFHADGTLSVAFVDDFNPPLTWTATIVTASQGVTGAFDSINAPQPADARLEFRAVYLPTQIRIGAFCRADANSDGLLNFFDISQFITNYNAGDPIADIAAPFGILNFFDIAEFMARYNTGCP